MSSSLFVNFKLNYFEALRRSEHWIEQARSDNPEQRAYALNILDTLRRLFIKHFDNLYMEG